MIGNYNIMLKVNQLRYLFLNLFLINNFSQLLSNSVPLIITNSNQDELLLHAPIKFSPSGMNCFLKHSYNHPKYQTDILPHNSGHLIQMLEHGLQTNQDYEYMIAAFRLFRQKISGCQYISATELERITHLVPIIISRYLDQKPSYQAKSKVRKLKNLALRLVENCLCKTLWDSTEPDQMLKELVTIGNQLELFIPTKLIDDADDLNDLLHMLIDRFIYVLDLVGSDLPPSFYADLKQRLDATSWVKITEIEDLIYTKMDKINQALLRGKVKNSLFQNCGVM